MKPSLDWLLVFVPISVGLHFYFPDKATFTFVAACLAIVPLAGWLGKATGQLAERTGEGIGGLLNATFGNAAELIIALMALHKGLYGVVKASLTGSIIGNLLLVMGGALLAGGVRYKTQKFNETAARSQSSMLLLAAISLIVPAAFHYLAGSAAVPKEDGLSLEISVVLITTYGLSLVFSLGTHKQYFGVSEAPPEEMNGERWPLRKSIGVIAGATALIAWLSEILVGSVEPAAQAFGMTGVFVGVIVVAIVGNAAEHSTAIMMAMKNRMDLSLGVSIGSSIQIALFVAPALVFASYFIGPCPMNLVFSPAEVMAIVVTVVITGQVTGDGESNWLEGVQLLAVYIILGIVFYFLPEAPQH